jgi:hypothetical protein
MQGALDQSMKLGIDRCIRSVDVRLIDNGLKKGRADLRSGYQCRDLLLFTSLPLNELFDVGMVDVNDDHLGSTTRCAATLDSACRSVEDLQEGHEATGYTAP